MRILSIFTIALAAGAFAFRLTPANAQSVHYRKLVSYAPAPNLGIGEFSLSDNDIVAYQLTNQTTRQVIKATSPATVQVIAENSAFGFSQFDGIDVNNAGVVVFLGQQQFGAGGVYTATSSADVTRIFSNSGLITQPAINNNGDVYVTAVDAFSPAALVGRTGSGPMVPVALLSDYGLVGFGSPNPLAVRGDGAVLFRAERTTGTGGGEGFYVYKNGAVTPLIETKNTLLSQILPFSRPFFNDAGQATFVATVDAGQENGDSELFRVNADGTLDNIVPAGSPFLGVGSTPALRQDGSVIFYGAFDFSGTQSGLFLTQNDGGYTSLIQTGDALFGSTLAGFNAGLDTNAKGEFAFHYRLASGEVGLALGSFGTAAAPEPASLAMVMGALLFLPALRRRKRG